MKSPSWILRHSLAKRVENSLLRSHFHNTTRTASSSVRASIPTHQSTIRPNRPSKRPLSTTPPRANRPQPGDNPNFHSILDNPPQLVRTGQKHGPGLIILAIIPVTAFALGTWQVHRLGWKSDLLAKFEDRLVRDPLPLPPRVDPDAVSEFDYRRVWAKGRYRHDQEMLIGPRMRDGADGYLVVTPLEREDEAGRKTRVLVNRGWIDKKLRRQRDRPVGLPQGEVLVEGLLREPWKKNMFTPENRPDKWEFYFPDVKQMAELTDSQPVWVEQTMEPDMMQVLEMHTKGIPIGRAAEVNLRNNHAQYIFTWYGLAVATSIMFYMVVKKPPKDVTRRVRQNTQW